MNELQTIAGFDAKIYGTNEDPLFLAKEVADMIGHAKTSVMMQQVDDDEKLKETMFTSGQNRDVWFLTEDGLYEVLMTSRKPIAKKFKKAVKQVLKTIRTTGRFEMQPMTEMEQIALIAQGTTQLKATVDNVVSEVHDLKENFGLPGSKRRILMVARRKQVVNLLGGHDSNAYRKISKIAFGRIGRDFKERFNVERYEDVPMSRFDEALEYTEHWQLPTNLALDVRELNAQTELVVEQ